MNSESESLTPKKVAVFGFIVLAASALIAWSLITLYSASPGLEEFPEEEGIQETEPIGEQEAAEETETKEEKGAANKEETKAPAATPIPTEKK